MSEPRRDRAAARKRPHSRLIYQALLMPLCCIPVVTCARVERSMNHENQKYYFAAFSSCDAHERLRMRQRYDSGSTERFCRNQARVSHHGKADSRRAENKELAAHLTENCVISFTNTSSDTWDKICLRDYAAANLELENSISDDKPYTPGSIREVKDSRGNALSFSVQEDKSVVYVQLPSPLKPGERTSVSIDYSTEIPCCFERLCWSPNGDDSRETLSACRRRILSLPSILTASGMRHRILLMGSASFRPAEAMR
mgnify:CR=1 FL=1